MAVNIGTRSLQTPVSIANGGTAVASVTTSPTATAFAGWDAQKNISANSCISGYTTVATSAAVTTLTVSSTYQQYFTGSTTQTVTLPVASTLVNGQQYQISNRSSGVVTVQTSGANTVQAMTASTQLILTCINTAGGTGTASWNWIYQGAVSAPTAPTVQRFTSSSGTYTTPANVLYLRVLMAGGGGGGGGGATQAANNATGGGTGVSSTFGSSLLTAGGGVGGAATGSGGTGGTCTISGPAVTVINSTGNGGMGSLVYNGSSVTLTGLNGGAGSMLGGGAPGVYNGASGTAGVANTGGGGGAGSANVAAGLIVGGAGGGGGYLEAIISAPSATYAYAVGTGGTAGAAGTSGTNGAAGGSGVITVVEYYQ